MQSSTSFVELNSEIKKKDANNIKSEEITMSSSPGRDAYFNLF